jgi:hypothetical protein
MERSDARYRTVVNSDKIDLYTRSISAEGMGCMGTLQSWEPERTCNLNVGFAVDSLYFATPIRTEETCSWSSGSHRLALGKREERPRWPTDVAGEGRQW